MVTSRTAPTITAAAAAAAAVTAAGCFSWRSRKKGILMTMPIDVRCRGKNLFRTTRYKSYCIS